MFFKNRPKTRIRERTLFGTNSYETWYSPEKLNFFGFYQSIIKPFREGDPPPCTRDIEEAQRVIDNFLGGGEIREDIINYP